MSRSADTVRELQAEVERLRNNRDQAANEVGRLSQEVGRLRAELANKHGGDGSVLHVTRESQDALYADRDMARAEVERLRGERDIEYQRAEAYKDEVERLREALKQTRLHREANMPGAADAWMYSEELRQAEAEVERLRDSAAKYRQAAEDKLAENERLRAELEKFQWHRDVATGGEYGP